MRRVEVVLDTVVAAPWQLLGDVCPLVSQALVKQENLYLFGFADGVLLDVGVQVVVPSTPERKVFVHWQTYLSRHYLPVR